MRAPPSSPVQRCLTAALTPAPPARSTADPGWSYQCPGATTLSAKCRYYLQSQESNYACDPNLQSTYYVSTIPLCSSYCSAWFDACADDFTCQTDWLNWNTTAGFYSCPAGSQCQTFRSRYSDAEGLCTNMWPSVYSYSSNTATWCVLMDCTPHPHHTPASGSRRPRLHAHIHTRTRTLHAASPLRQITSTKPPASLTCPATGCALRARAQRAWQASR